MMSERIAIVRRGLQAIGLRRRTDDAAMGALFPGCYVACTNLCAVPKGPDTMSKMTRNRVG